MLLRAAVPCSCISEVSFGNRLPDALSTRAAATKAIETCWLHFRVHVQKRQKLKDGVHQRLQIVPRRCRASDLPGDVRRSISRKSESSRPDEGGLHLFVPDSSGRMVDAARSGVCNLACALTVVRCMKAWHNIYAIDDISDASRDFFSKSSREIRSSFGRAGAVNRSAQRSRHS